MRGRLMGSTALPTVIQLDKDFPRAPDTLLRHMKPGQQHTYFISREYGNEIHVVDNKIVVIDGLDVGGYGLRYTTYAKMNEHEKEWARLGAKCYTFKEREVRAQIHKTGIIQQLLVKHLKDPLFAPQPWFPYNPMGAGA